jgi:hypothetical protein
MKTAMAIVIKGLHMKKYPPKRLAVLLGIMLASSIVVVYVCRPTSDLGVSNTKRNLRVLRYNIAEFHTRFGSYPKSLADIAKLHASTDLQNNILKRAEFITTRDGCYTQTTELNDQGGWFYDPNAGTVQVNATKPLKDYLSFYHGPERHTRPSDW